MNKKILIILGVILLTGCTQQIAEQLAAEGVTCLDICESQPHPGGEGFTWNISGSPPNCKCQYYTTLTFDSLINKLTNKQYDSINEYANLSENINQDLLEFGYNNSFGKNSISLDYDGLNYMIVYWTNLTENEIQSSLQEYISDNMFSVIAGNFDYCAIKNEGLSLSHYTTICSIKTVNNEIECKLLNESQSFCDYLSEKMIQEMIDNLNEDFSLLIKGVSSTKSYYYEAINVNVTELPNGDLNITEEQVFNFNGSFSYIYKYFYDDIKNFSVSSDGKPLSFTKEGNNYKWEGNWTNTIKSFVLNYVISNPFDLSSESKSLYYTVIFKDRSVPVKESTSYFNFYNEFNLNDISVNVNRGYINIPDNKTIRLYASNIPANQAFDANITIPIEDHITQNNKSNFQIKIQTPYEEYLPGETIYFYSTFLNISKDNWWNITVDEKIIDYEDNIIRTNHLENDGYSGSGDVTHNKYFVISDSGDYTYNITVIDHYHNSIESETIDFKINNDASTEKIIIHSLDSYKRNLNVVIPYHLYGIIHDGWYDISRYEELYGPAGEQEWPDSSMGRSTESSTSTGLMYEVKFTTDDSYVSGNYTLRIRVNDHISGEELVEEVSFSIP